MAHLKRTPIRSQRALTSPKPWFEFAFDGVNVQVFYSNCFHERREGHSLQLISLSRCQAHPDPKCRDSEWVYGIDMDGAYFFKPTWELPKKMMAHLGIYRPWLDEFELLEFVEE